MTRRQAVTTAVGYWLRMARDALASARAEAEAERFPFAMNRCYYAAYYAASAVLLSRGHRFTKHSGVRAGVHRHLVKPGDLPEHLGRFYDRLFRDRQQGDYLELVEFTSEQVEEAVRHAEEVVDALERLLDVTEKT